jgi:uncharacterized protein YbjT (DUF2867 family)
LTAISQKRWTFAPLRARRTRRGRTSSAASRAGDQLEPFVDADDIADVAVAALTDDRHIGKLYELTSPRLLTFAHAVGEIARATGREIRYVLISVEEYAAGAAEHGVPAEFVGSWPTCSAKSSAATRDRGRSPVSARPGSSSRRLRTLSADEHDPTCAADAAAPFPR